MMSSDGDDDPGSPSQFLEAPSSQSMIVDAKPFASQSNLERDHSADSDQDSYEDDRENRFAGPASTWRDYTADERALIASIDQERANDLSVHLYNAHALKSRLYDREISAKSLPWQSKQHWIKTEEDGSLPWYPDHNWTSWPLHADDVPRKSEGFSKDPLLDDAAQGTLRMPISWRAGTDLEDEVQALMMRKAKERFSARSWEATTKQSVPTRSRSRSASHLPSSPPPILTSRHSSVASESQSNGPDSENDATVPQDFSKPEITVDEEETARLLKPSARHVLSKLDDVLMALHLSRQYRAQGQIEISEPATKSVSQKRKRRSTTNGVPADTSDEVSISIANNGDRVKPPARDYTEHPSGDHALGPRDWSEVLGVASLAGWSPAVVDRATKRCAVLFGEHMTFRTMPETAAGNSADTLTNYHPETIPDLAISDEENMEIGEEAGSRLGFSCPESWCAQHHRLYEKRYMIRQHLRRVHQYDQEALDAYDQALTPADAKPSIENHEARQIANAEEESTSKKNDETQPLNAAVDGDGFMVPVDVFLGRGTDARDRKRRATTKAKGRKM
jgi:hypothetical protein